MKKKYELKGMTCPSCTTHVTGALLQLPEVQQADVQLNPQRVTLTMSKVFDVAELQAHISRTGDYTIMEMVQ